MSGISSISSVVIPVNAGMQFDFTASTSKKVNMDPSLRWDDDQDRALHGPLLRVLLLLVLLFPMLAMAAPRAWLDRDSIRMGETVTLNVETDARGGSEPDFSVLDANFRRLGTSSNTQLSWVNGRQSARTLWAVALEPREEGVLGIPALAVGNERTEPLALTVLPMPSGGSAAAGDDVFLEIESEPVDPYVQQQVRYTVRLYYAVTLLEGQLEEPQASGAQVRRLGQDVQYQKMLDERRYSVVERHYAIVPEASGRLEIPGPQFRGRALRTGGYGSLMNPNANLGARGNAIALEVRTRPATASTPWLPAQALSLTDESGDSPTTLQVGEPLTLTLRLSAQGLAAEQLPELVLPAIDGAEVYPDQETNQTRDDGAWLRGERVRKFAVVPTRAGKLVLPEIAVAWWDVANDRAARAVLPSREWSVAGAAGNTVAAPPTPAIESASSAATAAPVSSVAPAPWFWPLATALFATLWIATLVLMRRRRAADSNAPITPASGARIAPADWRSTWRTALYRADPTAAARALITAGQREWPSCQNLADVGAQLDDASQQVALARLEQVLYRGAEDPELIEKLRQVFADGPRWRQLVEDERKAGFTLPPLYPSRSPVR